MFCNGIWVICCDNFCNENEILIGINKIELVL